MRPFRQLTLAWTRSIIRDRSAMFFTFLLPVLFVVAFGLAFGRNDVGSYDIGVVADPTLPAGQALTQAMQSVKPFKVTTGPLDRELQELKDGSRHAVVEFVPGGSSPVGGTVKVHLDPSRTTAQQIVRPIINDVVENVDRRLTNSTPVLRVEEESVRSTNLRFIDFFLPGIIGFSIMQSGMFSAIPLVQLRVSRVLKRFGATPVSRAQVLLSQILVRVVLAVITTVLLFTVGKLVFGLRTDANWPAVVGLVVLGAGMFLAMGFAVSGVATTEEAVPALVQVVSFPMMFLAGVFWPVENFPAFLQPVTRILPLTFLGDGLRQAMVGGAALSPLWVNFLAILAWGAVSMLVAVRLFKWE